MSLGLREKGDAFIGAFAEWMKVDYLISENRHFLRELQTEAYAVMNAERFIQVMESVASHKNEESEDEE